MKVYGVIPVRMSSTRFPGKPMVDIAGLPMVHRVYDNAFDSGVFDRLVVAAEDDEIVDYCKPMGIDVVKTGVCKSGSDRVLECCSLMGVEDDDLVVNIQGDEPLIGSDFLYDLVKYGKRVFLLFHYGFVVTGVYELEKELASDIGIVKCVRNYGGRALYFSRCAVPYGADQYYGHVGVYCYPYKTLCRFSFMVECCSEKAEKLEQLRFLSDNIPIYTVETDRTIGVDYPEDVKKVEEVLRVMEVEVA